MTAAAQKAAAVDCCSSWTRLARLDPVVQVGAAQAEAAPVMVVGVVGSLLLSSVHQSPAVPEAAAAPAQGV